VLSKNSCIASCDTSFTSHRLLIKVKYFGITLAAL
jgi:hypothetical protein